MKFQIKHLREISSTNTLAKEYAAQGHKEGLVLVADYQSKGRGKPGRIWHSPRRKNLLFSVLLRPPVRAHRAPLITQIACRAVAKALKEVSGINASFKQPNDVMVEGKKICGVLTEMAGSASGKVESIIIGIGLNVNAEKHEIPPEGISLKLLKKKPFSKRQILEMILLHLKEGLKSFYAASA